VLTRSLTRRALVASSVLASSGIAAELARPAATARIRTQSAASLPDSTIWPSDPSYEEARRTFNLRLSRYPVAIAYCATPDDVSRSILWATQNDVPLSIRSGGHGYEGYAVLDDTLVIDLSEMNQIEVDLDQGTATVGAGVRLIDLYRRLWDYGMTVPAGTCPGVGIAGLTLGGGIGFLSRQFGLTCDNLLSVELVAADGSLVRTSRDEQPDLFWALRGGGGGNFGIVTSFTFLLTPIAEVTTVTISWPWDDAAAVLAAWQETAPGVDDRLTLGLTIGPPSDGTITMYGLLNAPSSLLWPLLEPLLAAGSPYGPLITTVPFIAAAEQLAGPGASHATFKNASAFAYEPLSQEAIVTLVDWLRDSPSAANLVGFFPLGGAVGRVQPRATAFPHRGALFDIQYQAYWFDPAEAEADLAWLRGIRDAMRPFSRGAYVNYIDADLPDWAGEYYGQNLSRLRRIKERYDPDGIFASPHSIPGA